jgi:hypothetical protein
METRKNHIINNTELININGNSITDQQLIANSFNNYFLTVAENITNNINKITLYQIATIQQCFFKNSKLSYLDMKIEYTAPKEIEKIIKSLK